ncbi:hypothetical protein AB0A69_09415 [Streptomyces sp. NPDC045431]|uniref:hypothetical protein n=1 Tax=Streptomyces sp. NPDC045431 TaxID=3155613 RepID=UPI0033D35522
MIRTRIAQAAAVAALALAALLAGNGAAVEPAPALTVAGDMSWQTAPAGTLGDMSWQ